MLDLRTPLHVFDRALHLVSCVGIKYWSLMFAFSGLQLTLISFNRQQRVSIWSLSERRISRKGVYICRIDGPDRSRNLNRIEYVWEALRTVFATHFQTPLNFPGSENSVVGGVGPIVIRTRKMSDF